MASSLMLLRNGGSVPSLLARLVEPIANRWPGMLLARLNGGLSARDRAGALTLTGSERP